MNFIAEYYRDGMRAKLAFSIDAEDADAVDCTEADVETAAADFARNISSWEFMLVYPAKAV